MADKIIGKLYVKKCVDNIYEDEQGLYLLKNNEKQRISYTTIYKEIKNYWDRLRYCFKDNKLILTSFIYDGIKLELYGESQDEFDKDSKEEMTTNLIERVADIAYKAGKEDN